MNANKLACVSIKSGTDARDWASVSVQRELALARCVMHLHWCDEPELVVYAAATVKAAIEQIIAHFDK